MKIRMFAAMCLGIVIAGCAVTGTGYDYDAGYDFSAVSSYDWLEMPVDYPADPFAAGRVKAAVDQQMAAKGFHRDTAAPDMILALEGYKTTIRREPESTSFSPVTGQRFADDQFQEGMFTLTMIDAKTDRLIWEGHAKGLAGPYRSTESRVQKTQETVAKLLAKFPPK